MNSSADDNPPQIVTVEHTVTDEADGLATAEIVATFNEGVQIRPIDVALLDSSGTAVAIANLGYDIAGHKLTILAKHLRANSSNSLRLLDTITDDALNPLDGEFDGYTFPSGDGPPAIHA